MNHKNLVKDLTDKLALKAHKFLVAKNKELLLPGLF